MKKRSVIAILSIILLSLLVLQGCTPADEPAETPTPAVTDAATAAPAAESADPAPAATDSMPAETASGELVLTLEALAQYDGQNGNPAYIAVDGVIYDVSNVPEWNGGGHNGFTAGHDLTEEIKTVSPHGVSKLNGLTVVGKLAE